MKDRKQPRLHQNTSGISLGLILRWEVGLASLSPRHQPGWLAYYQMSCTGGEWLRTTAHIRNVWAPVRRTHTGITNVHIQESKRITRFSFGLCQWRFTDATQALQKHLNVNTRCCTRSHSYRGCIGGKYYVRGTPPFLKCDIQYLSSAWYNWAFNNSRKMSSVALGGAFVSTLRKSWWHHWAFLGFNLEVYNRNLALQQMTLSCMFFLY